MRVRDLVGRRAPSLPPGQREVRCFPRFSDEPLRWAPAATPLDLAVSLDGDAKRVFTAADLAQFDHVVQRSDFHCVTTWTHRGVQWGGVRFVDVVQDVFDNELAPFLVATAADGRSAMFVTADLDADDVLLATELDGMALDRRHGAPLRLVSPGQYGYKSVKHLIGLDFSHDEPVSTLGAKEHLRARVDAEERHSSLPNWAVRLPYRLTIIPTALAAERGLRNSPGWVAEQIGDRDAPLR